MVLFAGLDGGASKSRVRVVDANGVLIGHGLAGPGSLTLGADVAADNVLQALRQVLGGSLHDTKTCRLVCGLAGHRQRTRRSAFESLMHDVGTVEVISDGYAALLGAHGGKPGAVVIVGTGSVGLGFDAEGRLHQVGGWGPIAGDEGGGNWLGRRAVTATLRAMDEMGMGDGPASPLTEALHAELGGRHETVLDWLAAADATRFAALVPLIVSHDRMGDPLAGRLLDDAAREADRLIQLSGRNGRLPVALLGGLADTLVSRLTPCGRRSLVPPAADAMDGALLRAQGLAPPEIYAP